jgi:hypothetical protein
LGLYLARRTSEVMPTMGLILLARHVGDVEPSFSAVVQLPTNYCDLIFALILCSQRNH